jgi:mono/diheme cytochrome c family protein
MRFLVLAALMLGGCVQAARPSSDFATYCAVCHGAQGMGDGPAAEGLAKKPADLTRLSARNGGEFPTTRVMSQIWGYAGGKGHGVMPEFAPLMAGDKVLFDGGDGIATPTPERLVALAEYLKGIQR